MMADESKGVEAKDAGDGGGGGGNTQHGGDGGDPNAWRDSTERTHSDKVARRVELARRSRRLDLADPRHEMRSAFRFSLDSIPKVVSQAFRSGALTELWLTNNKFSQVPDFVGTLPNLTTLCLSGNQVSSLGAPLFKCRKLQRLLLARNQLVALPPEFAELSALTELRLDHNHFARFPVAVTKARNLRRLGLSHNRIVSVPAAIRRLTNMVELDLDNNMIGPELPSELMRLGGLAVLGVANNCLESAPPVAKRPPGSVPLTVVRLSGNRSSSFKVYHESGMLLEGENIPRRADGYLELRKGYLITDLEGAAHHKVEELEGYVQDGYRYNVTSANWFRQAEEYKVLKARAKQRRIRAATQRAEKAGSADAPAGGEE